MPFAPWMEDVCEFNCKPAFDSGKVRELGDTRTVEARGDEGYNGEAEDMRGRLVSAVLTRRRGLGATVAGVGQPLHSEADEELAELLSRDLSFSFFDGDHRGASGVALRDTAAVSMVPDRTDTVFGYAWEIGSRGSLLLMLLLLLVVLLLLELLLHTRGVLKGLEESLDTPPRMGSLALSLARRTDASSSVAPTEGIAVGTWTSALPVARV